ncbi:gamma carbonic anhydrase family protein [Spirochaetia bacterium 38H-sp]|uniref:Gamma carbonic anhydrase family protein n=1 Tax=Rarispira pelagica TaxID=3141764 RepID=A0ABU9UCF1_9SPIR
MIYTIGDKKPTIAKSCFIADSATVSGLVFMEEKSSVWFGAVLRGDITSIHLGAYSNVQDNATVHVDIDKPVDIGSYVTIGHNAVIHGCIIGSNCLIGMGAIILSGATIGKNSIVGAGALVTEGKTFPDNSLILGSPARVIREVTEDEVKKVKENAELYVKLAQEAITDYKKTW